MIPWSIEKPIRWLLCRLGWHGSQIPLLTCAIDPGICEICRYCGHHAFPRHNSAAWRDANWHPVMDTEVHEQKGGK